MEKIIKNKLIRYIPAILWMCFIFYLSSGPTTAITGTSVQRFLILKSFHLVEYAVLYLLLNFAGFSSKKSILIAYLYALSDEFHQSFIPGRTGLFRDTFIDLLGIILAYIIIFLTRNKYHFTIK